MPTAKHGTDSSPTHQILWALDRELWKLLHIHSVRQCIWSDWLYQRELGRRRDRLHRRAYRDFRKRLWYLQRAACIVRSPQGQRQVWQLTAKGRLIALMRAAKFLTHQKRNRPARARQPNQWLVIFDIPEEQRRIRNLLRQILYGLGSRYLQRSVFLIKGTEGYQLIRHLVRVAKLAPYVILAQVHRLER